MDKNLFQAKHLRGVNLNYHYILKVEGLTAEPLAHNCSFEVFFLIL